MEKPNDLTLAEQKELVGLNLQFFGSSMFAQVTPEMEAKPEYKRLQVLVAKKQRYLKFLSDSKFA